MSQWGLVNPAGGFLYHCKALLYSKRLWSPFIREIGAWQESWPLQNREIILIGPSAGYSLSKKFIHRFERRMAVDPDPLASKLFQFRFGKCEWNTNDFFLKGDEETRRAEFKKFLEAHPQSAVLFCNFLGQLGVFWSESQIDREMKRTQDFLKENLSHRTWATYHDRFSGKIKPKRLRLSSDHALSNEELIDAFYPKNVKGELFDHHTLGFTPQSVPHEYWVWEISPNYYQLIEGARLG